MIQKGFFSLRLLLESAVSVRAVNIEGHLPPIHSLKELKYGVLVVSPSLHIRSILQPHTFWSIYCKSWIFFVLRSMYFILRYYLICFIHIKQKWKEPSLTPYFCKSLHLPPPSTNKNRFGSLQVIPIQSRWFISQTTSLIRFCVKI